MTLCSDIRNCDGTGAFPGGFCLDALLDVDVPCPIENPAGEQIANNEILVFDSSIQKWVNKEVSLEGLTDQRWQFVTNDNGNPTP